MGPRLIGDDTMIRSYMYFYCSCSDKQLRICVLHFNIQIEFVINLRSYTHTSQHLGSRIRHSFATYAHLLATCYLRIMHEYSKLRMYVRKYVCIICARMHHNSNTYLLTVFHFAYIHKYAVCVCTYVH